MPSYSPAMEVERATTIISDKVDANRVVVADLLHRLALLDMESHDVSALHVFADLRKLASDV